MVLSAANGSVSIALFATIVVALVEKTSASLNLFFSISSGITKKLFKTMRKKIKKHNKIISFTRSKLNSIENIISKALLIDDEISLEDFTTILNEEKITDMWRRWGTPQNFALAFIDELEKQLLKKLKT